MKVTYHQEFNDVTLDLKDHKIPASQRADNKDWAGKALFLGTDAVVLEPVEGPAIGQYTPIPEPEPEKKGK